jgi:hypothetical protein
MFLDNIRADVSHGGFDQNKQQLIQHLQTRTAHARPRCVQSITISADLTTFISARPDVTPTVSIVIVGYVQTKSCREFTMTNWLRDATWNPVSGGLCSNSEFLADMERADDPSMPGWCKLPIFGELGLNNQGRIAASNKRKVFAHFQQVSRSISCAVLTLLCVLPAEDGCVVLRCWLLGELRIHALRVKYPGATATAASEFGESLPVFQSRPPVRRLLELSPIALIRAVNLLKP